MKKKRSPLHKAKVVVIVTVAAIFALYYIIRDVLLSGKEDD